MRTLSFLGIKLINLFIDFYTVRLFFNQLLLDITKGTLALASHFTPIGCCFFSYVHVFLIPQLSMYCLRQLTFFIWWNSHHNRYTLRWVLFSKLLHAYCLNSNVEHVGHQICWTSTCYCEHVSILAPPQITITFEKCIKHIHKIETHIVVFTMRYQ